MSGGGNLLLHNQRRNKHCVMKVKCSCHFPLLSFELSNFKFYLNYEKVKHLKTKNKIINKIKTDS